MENNDKHFWGSRERRKNFSRSREHELKKFLGPRGFINGEQGIKSKNIKGSWEHVPPPPPREGLRDAKIRDKSLPWINTSIRKEMNKRYYKLLRDAKLSGDPEKWKLYKEKRNAVKKLLKRAKAAYWQTSFEEASNPSEFRRLTNPILRKIKAKGIGPIAGPNEEILTQNLAKAEYFNERLFCEYQRRTDQAARSSGHLISKHLHY